MLALNSGWENPGKWFKWSNGLYKLEIHNGSVMSLVSDFFLISNGYIYMRTEFFSNKNRSYLMENMGISWICPGQPSSNRGNPMGPSANRSFESCGP